jgi:hypothetical protein
MKQNLTTIKAMMIASLIILSCYSVNAQTPWNIGGNTVSGTSEVGTSNNHTLKIVTNGDPRITIGTNDTILFRGTALFDSIKIPHGFIYADSMRCRVLHVGDSSLILGTNITPGTIAIGANFIKADNNAAICFGRHTGAGTLNGNFPGVTIGTMLSSYKLHIHDDGTNTTAWTHYTNTATGQSTNNGLLVGIFRGAGGGIADGKE